MRAGATTPAVVRAPAGYRLRMHLALTEVEAPERTVIEVTGDVVGNATVTIDESGPTTEVTLAWSLAPDRPLLRVLALVARPVLVRGHDRILDDGFHRCLEATGLDLVPVSPPG